MYFYARSISNLPLSGAGITASTQNPYFPVSNILGSPLACATWRSLTENTGTETLSIDLNGTQVVANFPNGIDVLIDYWNAASACSSVTWTLYNGASIVSTDTVTLSGSAAGPGWFNLTTGNMGSGVTSLLLTFTRTGGPNYIEMGKVLVGARLDSTIQVSPDHGNFTRTFGEHKNSSQSVLGQNFSEKLAIYWQGNLSIPYAPEPIQNLIRTQIFEALGTFSPFWVIIVPGDSSTSELGFPRYVKMTSVPTEKEVAYGSYYVWGISFNLEKQL